jgi:hypothetical protein
VHLTFSKLVLPGSKTKKVIIDRKSSDIKPTEYQLQLEFKN